MTYDEHTDYDNQLCEAEDEIIKLQAENKRLKQQKKDLVIKNKLLRLSLNTTARKLEQALKGG